MGQKDKKNKAAEKKARVAAKQNSKAAKKEKKGRVKGSADSDGEDEDLESVLAQYAQQVIATSSSHFEETRSNADSKRNF